MSRAHIHLPTTLGDSLSDAIATNMGSWKFIISQTLFVVLWMSVNLVAATYHWDPYPWILLNLIFSTQAAYAAPIIMMAQNRQANKDRRRDDIEAQEVEQLVQAQKSLHSINEAQLEILKLLQSHIAGDTC
jgi:uncharacterized membrane protein